MKKDKKLHFSVDKNLIKENFYNKIKKLYKNYSAKKADVIVVIGGDGFMLQSLKKYYKYQKPFYGINKGTFGFLMNKFKTEKIHDFIKKSKQITISPLEMISLDKNNKKNIALAINEVSLLRQSKQTASLQIKNGNRFLTKKLICDGVLICTPAGSTAYNLSVYGPILSLDSKKIAVTPISPFRPRRWKGKVVSSNSFIKIRNLNTKKRPISAVADNYEIRNIKEILIKVNKKVKFKLLYDRNDSLNKKIKFEQLKKETS